MPFVAHQRRADGYADINVPRRSGFARNGGDYLFLPRGPASRRVAVTRLKVFIDDQNPSTLAREAFGDPARIRLLELVVPVPPAAERRCRQR